MQVFYCILLVIVIFFTIMEIVADGNTNILVRIDNHKYHLGTYVIIFLVIASLLIAEKCM